jgi:hypothetical protein
MFILFNKCLLLINYTKSDSNSLSPDEFRTQILNKLKLDHQLYDSPTSNIIINTRDEIVISILNWLFDANALDILKRPIIRINDEE